MQDRATLWHDMAIETRPKWRPSLRPTIGPVATGVLLTAGTLVAASTFVCMLPVTGRSRAAAPPYVSRAHAARSADAPPYRGRSTPIVPTALFSMASTAAHTLANWERQIDAARAAAMAAPLPGASDAVVPVPTGELHAPATAMAQPVRPTGERIVYLVDASGSLLDSLPQVIDWLGESLDDLGDHQRFTVMFFRRGDVSEVPPAGLKQATFATKAAVWSWMQPEQGNVLPHGRSDVTGALEAALRYDADDVVILSDDAFSRRAASADEDAVVLDEVARILDGHDTRVHTVQFFYRDAAGALEAIADRFDGGYEFIEPTPRDTTAEVDPLLDTIIN